MERKIYVTISIAALLIIPAVAAEIIVYDRPFAPPVMMIVEDPGVFDIDAYIFRGQEFYASSDIYASEIIPSQTWPFPGGKMLTVVSPGAPTYAILDTPPVVTPNPVFRSITCDEDERSVTFTMENTGEKRWDFSQSTEWVDFNKQINARLFINGYEVNRQFTYTREGEALFFPAGETFIQQCEGDAILLPGEQMRCTVEPAPLELGNFGNTIWVDTPPANDPAYFLCT